MLDKYKDKNEFYSLVGIKCYSYVPSLLSLNQRPRKILNYLSPIEYLVRKII
ncbi:hypothetical protein [Spiroplasma endosymbiont of Tipula paludosa]|uniref:hypothetical protein n=1 Tax=Spiroplasma endosymbiont of Tipula paludosa TaxID=3066295 RepID=UPI0035C8AB3F